VVRLSIGTQRHDVDAVLLAEEVSCVVSDTYVRILSMPEFRITVAVARVLREFLLEPTEARHGYELMQVTGYPSGKLYPILARLVRAGWLTRDREIIDPAREGRPARYLYHLTAAGAESARYELAALSEQLAPPPAVRPRLRPEGGRT
jgi:PadR family transcriptional regulator